MWTRRLPAAVAAVALFPVLVVAAGCSAFRFSAGPDLDVDGVWQGGMRVAGQSVSGRLELSQDANDLRGTFRSPLLTTSGNGRIEDDGSFTLTLSYDVDCPGTARLEGRVAEDGARISGSVAANDCSGDASGTFSFDKIEGD